MGKNPRHRENFRIGREAGVWGNKSDVYSGIQLGDRICFVHQAPIRKRRLVPGGTIERVVLGRVTRAPYESEDAVWPDDVYRYRFGFEVEGELENVALPSDLLPASSIPVLQKAINANGKPRQVVLDASETDSYQLGRLFRDVASLYPNYRSGKKVDGGAPVDRIVKQLIPAALQGIAPDFHIELEGSTGKGNVTAAPWIAAFDPSITTSAKRGFYVVYLLSTDFKHLYLSLALGAQQFDGGNTKKARDQIAFATERLRDYLPDSALGKFEKRRLELRPEGAKLHAAYEDGSIASIKYRMSSLPEEQELRGDFYDALLLYRKLKDEVGPRMDEALADEGADLCESSIATRSLDSPRSDAGDQSDEKRSQGGSAGNRSSDAYKVGRHGEKLVVDYERQRLIECGRRDLADRVRWLADEGEKPGYDILSFDEDGDELWIEVKSTKSPTLDRVVLTRNEWAAAQSGERQRYCLYCVTSVFKDPVIHVLRDLYSAARDGNPIPESWLFELPSGSWDS